MALARSPGDVQWTIADRAVLGLDTDPFCQHRFVSYGDEPVLKFWDMRQAQTPLFACRVSPSREAAIAEARFSTTRRGVIAILARDEDHLVVWKLQETERHDAALSSDVADRLILGKIQRSRRRRSSAVSRFSCPAV
jgi:hypothetical protein